jgi:hypothetical protein
MSQDSDRPTVYLPGGRTYQIGPTIHITAENLRALANQAIVLLTEAIQANPDAFSDEDKLYVATRLEEMAEGNDHDPY